MRKQSIKGRVERDCLNVSQNNAPGILISQLHFVILLYEND